MDISSVVNVSHATLDAFYPGVHGARAIAAALFGDYSPGGKLPYTYYRKGYTSRIDMTEFSMAQAPGRGYRYMDPHDPDILYPFGYGLSYTSFDVRLAANSTGPLSLANADDANEVVVTFTVTNTGTVRGAETVLVYFRPDNATNPGGAHLLPLQRQLVGFAKVRK
jgi:beta-glucosidase